MGRFVIDEILSYIEDNLDQDLSLDDIARKFNYSKFYLNRVFSEQVGCTMYKYVQICRLAKAAQKLVETKESIVEIAYEAHYGSQQAFTLAFQRRYLCTPQVYRKRGVIKTELLLRCAAMTTRKGMMAA